jgi:hypothetical protein
LKNGEAERHLPGMKCGVEKLIIENVELSSCLRSNLEEVNYGKDD